MQFEIIQLKMGGWKKLKFPRRCKVCNKVLGKQNKSGICSNCSLEIRQKNQHDILPYPKG
ncbi:MAG: hypothetical protein ABSG05_03385 [Candidatus Pacearchaeota archaeon]